MSLTSALRRAAVVNPSGLATVQQDQRCDWRALTQRVAHLAGGLQDLGVQPGQRVAILAANSPQYFEMIFAVWWLGAVLVPLNTRLATDEITVIVEHAGARLLLTDAAMEDLAQRCNLAHVARIALTRDTIAALRCAKAAQDAHPDLESLAGIFYTGGTTGLPKGVALSHRHVTFAALGMLRDWHFDEASVYLHATPMFHLADFGIGLGATLAASGHSFLARFTPQAFYQRLQDEGVTHVQLVPTMIAAVLDAPCRDDALLARIQRIAYGAAPISKALLTRTLRAFPNARIQQFYGMTEACGATVMLGPERHVLDGPMAGKLTAAGRCIPGVELRIANDAGASLPVGQVGEIQMRGPAVMQGYWNAPELTQAAFVDGWLKSGDAGYLDADGFLYVVDRLKDMIISGAENIYCSEVENALASHPAVQAAAVVGIPDARWGERVHAVIVLRPTAATTVEALDAHCRQQIAGYKVPRSYAFVDALPLSGVGKVKKQILRNQCVKTIHVARKAQQP